MRMPVFDRINYTAATAFASADNRAGWHQHTGHRRRWGAPLLRRFEEGNAHAHVGKNARILLVEPDPHLDGGFVAIRSRNDGHHVRRDIPVRIGIQQRLCALPCLDAIDVGLVHIDLDLE